VTVKILIGDCRDFLRTLPDESVHCVVTSPPYFGLRDYGVDGQVGQEATPAEFVGVLVEVFREVRRVLRADGTLWLNLGDSYANTRGGKEPGLYTDKRNSGATWQARVTELPPGLKPKDLIGIPWRAALALQADGWWLRQDIIWSKPNPMPESVTDRCTKAHEYIFMLTKSERYHYDAEAIAEPAIYSGLANQDDSGFKYPRSFNGKHKDGYRTADRDVGIGSKARPSKAVPNAPATTRNKRSVWEVATRPFSEAHFATFPPDLIVPCIKAGCPVGGTVLDPFGGAGTTGLVADRLQRNAILIELNPEYAAMARKRIDGDAPLFASAAE
jgi:DNA modification methylase